MILHISSVGVLYQVFLKHWKSFQALLEEISSTVTICWWLKLWKIPVFIDINSTITQVQATMNDGDIHDYEAFNT